MTEYTQETLAELARALDGEALTRYAAAWAADREQLRVAREGLSEILALIQATLGVSGLYPDWEIAHWEELEPGGSQGALLAGFWRAIEAMRQGDSSMPSADAEAGR